jgi:uncharacterized protein YdhG (YjbR/CyaY superfamily)
VSAQREVLKYLVALPAASRRRMNQMRRTIRAAAPGAEEGYSYRMPCFRLDGRILLWYAAFKAHTSLFLPGGVPRALAGALKGRKTSKGTVQFPLDQPLPVTLVKRLVRARVAQLRANR